MSGHDWTNWSERRPPDGEALYIWRCGTKPEGPEWVEKFRRVGMGYAAPQYWPVCSYWDGYHRTVAADLQWAPLPDGAKENDVFWPGLALLPCPFCGGEARIETRHEYMFQPVYQHKWARVWALCGHAQTRWKSVAEAHTDWNHRVT